MQYVVCFSGGHSSALAAIETVRRYGKEGVVLLNHDLSSRVEHHDIKRFKREVAQYLGLPITFANVSDFWSGQKEIKVLDPNITACKDKRDLMAQYRETGAIIDFTQGLDIRLLNDADIEDINQMRIGTLHFAWDNPKDDLERKFKAFSDGFRRNSNIGMVYCLVNFNSTMEENLYRIYTLRDMGYDPYVMVYDKPHAPKEIRRLQRWCNNKIIFKSCPDFKDYVA